MKLILAICVACLVLLQVRANKKLICYWQSWSVYRQGDGNFDTSRLDPNLCTHLIYTFVGISKTSDAVVSLDPWLDLPNGGGRNNMGNFNRLRERNPQLKTLVAIGGWGEGSGKYSRMVSDPILRGKFVESTVGFLKRYGFNGFDIDWEYPSQREGSLPSDKQNFVLLLKELRERFDREGLLLSAAVGPTEALASPSYIIPEVSKYLHFINLMSYNLHGVWDNKTGMNAGLYPASSENGKDTKLNVDAVINYWLSQGAPADKLIMGTAFYGRSFTLTNPQLNGVGAPATAGTGPFSGEAGIFNYNEICERIKRDKWIVRFDQERKVPYAIYGNQWVSYDNEQSLREKANYIKQHNLGGAMVWSVETDDFLGKCGENFPLLKTLSRELAITVGR